jgi:hypothetical protein
MNQSDLMVGPIMEDSRYDVVGGKVPSPPYEMASQEKDLSFFTMILIRPYVQISEHNCCLPKNAFNTQENDRRFKSCTLAATRKSNNNNLPVFELRALVCDQTATRVRQSAVMLPLSDSANHWDGADSSIARSRDRFELTIGSNCLVPEAPNNDDNSSDD